MATYTSSLESIGAWRHTRLPLGRFAPLAGLIAWAACSSAPGVGRVVAASLLAFSLVAQSRLWDDLVDRDRDRGLHPERVLARSDQPQAFVQAALSLGLFNIAALALLSGWPQALGLAALMAFLAGWYRVHEARGLVHAHALLLKYPAFVLLLAAPGRWLSTMAAAVALYSALCAFELLDADAQPQGAGSTVFAGHALVLTGLPLLVGHGVPAVLVSAACAALLTIAFVHQRARGASVACHLPFGCAIFILFIGSLGGQR